MARINHRSMENRIAILRGYADLWAQYFRYFTENLAKVEITEEMERDYENIITILAINHFKFSELCGEYMKDADGIMKLLSEMDSLQTIKETNEATLGKHMVETHTTLIDMHKALGKMLAKLTPKQLAAMQQQDAAPQ